MKDFSWFSGILAVCLVAIAQCSCVSINATKNESDKSASRGDKNRQDELAGQKIDASGYSRQADSDKGQLITGDGNATPAGRPDTEQVVNGTIYWSKCQIVADGIGMAPAKYTGSRAELMAMRAARIDAARNALTILLNVKAGSSSLDSSMPVQGILKNFEEIDCSYNQQTRTATCTIRVRF